MVESITFALSEKDRKYFETKSKTLPTGAEERVLAVMPEKLARISGMLRAGGPDTPDYVLRFVEDMRLLFGMLSTADYYSDAPTKRLIVYALGYFLEPMDAVPDSVPLVGFLDDIMVVVWVAESLRDKITEYKQFLRGDAGE